MGLLENTIGAMLGHAPGEGSSRPEGGGSPYAPMAAALIGLLAAKAATGGFGNLGGLLGGARGGSQEQVPTAPAPSRSVPASAEDAGAAPGGGLLAGLGGLLEKFQQSGHGGVMDSWVGHGANQPVTPTQVSQALGDDTVKELAHRTGMSAEQVAAQLSQGLPNIIDRLTPAGRMPQPDEIARYR